MSLLLDTNICIYAMKQHPVVLPRLLALRRADVFVSVVTEAELLTGAAKSREPDRTLERVERFLAPIT
ncbi:MAG: type II toxin-antitoxin system VapC family toxin, partial [Deltaproteobacteria bacterium]